MEARTAAGSFRGRRPIAVAGFAPKALSLVATLLLPVLGVTPAAGDQLGPDQAKIGALQARITADATHIHQLTGQLDQARLQVSSTAARLLGVTRQHDATVQGIGANRAILVDQALRAYMHGGAAATPVAASASWSADVTLRQEYLRVASGDLANTGDQLRQLETNLRRDEATLQSAQRASQEAATQLQLLRTNALSTAAHEQVQLDGLQTQLVAQAQAQAQAQAPVQASPSPPPTSHTQGVPVNNGLVSVVQQAAGLPIATPVANTITTALGGKPVTTPTTSAPAPPPAASSSGGGGHAGGVWLSLRQCESSDNYAENTGNGYYGAYQFSQSTWSALGFPGRPDQESPAMQDQAAMKLQAQSGWGQWPACSAALGL